MASASTRNAVDKKADITFVVAKATTIDAMKELDDGKDQRLDTAEELFRDLWLESG